MTPCDNIRLMILFPLPTLLLRPTLLMLDVVITKDADYTVSMVEVSDPGLSDGLGKVSHDYLAVIIKAYVSRPATVRKAVSFRKPRSNDVDSCRRRDIQNSKAPR